MSSTIINIILNSEDTSSPDLLFKFFLAFILYPSYYKKKCVIIYMAGFLSSNMESAINTMYNTLHETFARTITVFKNSKRTVISTNTRYNNIYGRSDTGSRSNIQYETESQTFEARVYYVNMDEEYLSNNENQRGTQNKIILPNGSVKIVVKIDAYEFLQEARRVELDGIRFAIKSDGTPRGLATNKFYTFLLTPTDE